MDCRCLDFYYYDGYSIHRLFFGRKWIKNLRNFGSNLENNPLDEAVKIYDNLHQIETQLIILNENKRKSGIYLIYNKINKNFYIGSAITNRINVRFRNHMFHGTGSRITKKAIQKYGIENFKFAILEYYPGIILKENLKTQHLLLLEREDFYIKKYEPRYNILMSSIPGTLNVYKHSIDTREKKKRNFLISGEERKNHIRQLNKGKVLPDNVRLNLSIAAQERYKNDPGQRERISKLNSKPVVLLDEKLNRIKEFPGVRSLSKYLGCCHKTVNKAIKKETFLKGYYIRYKTK